ncbi:MAG: acyl-CoA dehydrogenase family protein [Bacillota bacterium]
MVEIYTEEHKLFRDTLRKFIDKEVTPFIDQWEVEGQYPRELWKKFGENGYLLPWADEKYGGAGVGFEYSCIINEELSYAGCSIAVSLHNNIVAPYIYNFGNEEQKMKWLPRCSTAETLLCVAMTEPSGGSDLQNMRSTAVKDGDDYIINGQKVFITNGYSADLIVLACKTDPKAVPKHKGVSLILVEANTPGITRRKLRKLGVHSQDTAEIFFEDVRVPQTNLLGQEGRGFYYLMDKLQQERLTGVIGCQARAERILHDAIEYAKSREAFGQPIIKFQANTFKVVEMATEIELGRVFADALLADHLAGKNIVKRVSMAKWWITEMLNRVAYQCLQLHGGYGFMEEYPIARFYRDARMHTIAAGTTEIMKTIIAKEMGL